MIRAREFNFLEDSTLYHYCSPDTFLAICQTGTLRFSELSGMNDFMERRWGLERFYSVVNKTVGEMGKGFTDQLVEAVEGLGHIGIPLATCFSRKRDVLSQWRAYAADGVGFSIGFDPLKLVPMPVRTLCIEYDHDVQMREIEQHLRKLHAEFSGVDITTKGPERDRFERECAFFAYDLAAYKNTAFQEEAEVRQLHVTKHVEVDGRIIIDDIDSSTSDVDNQRQPVRFRMHRGIPVAYVDLDFTAVGTVAPIREVVIGPRNTAPVDVVSRMLETLKIPAVKVVRSVASYR